MPDSTELILDARACERTLRRMADSIVERTGGTEGLVLVGIQRRGVQLAGGSGAMIRAARRAD
jgi:pyrimidine operon attenuation protein / uracil phosphoribosyltransferase